MPGNTVIGLLEALKNAFQPLRRDANTRVNDIDASGLLGHGVALDPYGHLSPGRKLQGITDEIEEDLSEFARISVERGKPRWHFGQEWYLRSADCPGELCHHVLDEGGEPGRGALQFHTARFNL